MTLSVTGVFAFSLGKTSGLALLALYNTGWQRMYQYFFIKRESMKVGVFCLNHN